MSRAWDQCGDVLRLEVEMEVSEAQRLKQLEDENQRLKHLVADLSLDREALKALVLIHKRPEKISARFLRRRSTVTDASEELC